MFSSTARDSAPGWQHQPGSWCNVFAFHIEVFFIRRSRLLTSVVRNLILLGGLLDVKPYFFTRSSSTGILWSVFNNLLRGVIIEG